LAENVTWTFQEIIVIILRKWRLVIVFSLIMALLFGGYRLVTGWVSLHDQEAMKNQQADYEQSVENFQKDMDSLNLSLGEYEAKLAQIPAEMTSQEEKITRTKDYLQNSLLMNLDPANVCVSSMDIIIDTDYKIMPGMAYQDPNPISDLLAAYQQTGASEAVYDAIRGRLDEKTASKYLSELITIEPIGSSMLRITCRYERFEAAEEIVNTIYEHLLAKTDLFNAMIGTHRLTNFELNSSMIADAPLKALQEAELENLSALQNKRDQILKELNDTQKLFKDTNAQLQSLQMPANPTPNVNAVLKGALKYLLLGIILGLVVIMLFIVICSQIEATIKDGRNIKRRLPVRLLGTVPALDTRRRSRLDHWIDYLDQPIDNGPSKDENYRMIRARLISSLDPDKTYQIICIGLCAFELLQQSVRQLAETFQACGDEAALPPVHPGKEPKWLFIPAESNLTSAETVIRTAQSDLVVIFVNRGKTTFHELEQSIEVIKAADKKLAGVAIL
jgi:capsular polysaccharide biosynthesis protein